MKRKGLEKIQIHGECSDYPDECESNKCWKDNCHKCIEVDFCARGEYIKEINLIVLAKKIRVGGK